MFVYWNYSWQHKGIEEANINAILSLFAFVRENVHNFMQVHKNK